MRDTFRVLVWQSATGLYFPDGAYKIINCKHVADGNFGINMEGEIVPAPRATAPIEEAGTNDQHATVGIRAGHIYPSATQFSDNNFKAVTRVKDLVTNETYYADATDYATASATCNDCCIAP